MKHIYKNQFVLSIFSVLTYILIASFMLSAQSSFAQSTLQIINNFNSKKDNSADYFTHNYSDDQIWLYFLNTNSSVTYKDIHGTLRVVSDTKAIPLSKVKDGKFSLGLGGVSSKVFAALGSSNPFTGDNGPGVFDKDIPYALAEWTIAKDKQDNIDLSYEDSFSFPTIMTVYNANNVKTDQASFQKGTQAEDVIDALKAALPTKPVGPDHNNYPSSGDSAGWGPLVPTVSGDTSANRCIGSSKTWTSGPNSSNLRSLYIYAPTLNDYLKFLHSNATSQFNNGITGWFIDYSGNGGYSGYLTITGSDNNYGLRIHDIRVNTDPSAANKWKADSTAGDLANGEITVAANGATLAFDAKTNVTGLWTDGVIYSGAALVGTLGGGPVVTGTGDFASDGDHKDIVATMLASISASMATGLLGSDMYNAKITATTPGSTMYWFNTMTRAESTHKLFEKAWTGSEKYYDPYWKTMAELTNMQGYLSPFNDRWQNFSPDYDLGADYRITWELGILNAQSGDYSLSGSISGDVMNGVSITLSGDASRTTTSDVDGNYSFLNLPNGSYTVSPSLTGHNFSPSNSSVIIAANNQPGKDFSATSITPDTHSISGKISGAVKENVRITLSGDSSATTMTSSEGSYLFHNLSDGNYTVTPFSNGHSFSPSGRSVTILGEDEISQDFTSTGTQAALGSVWGIESENVHGLPESNFMVKPKVYSKYDLGEKSGLKAKAKLLTKIPKTTGTSYIKCQWTKKLRLYNKKAFKNALKEGTSASDWIADSRNQENLEMELCLLSKEAQDQFVQTIALALPVITHISSGGQDAKGNDILIISGKWFGTRRPKVKREYTIQGATGIKQQSMKVVKPTQEDADLGYKSYKGKPSFMNIETGASKVVVVVPSRNPKGTLNGTIVLDNGIGIATGTAP